MKKIFNRFLNYDKVLPLLTLLLCFFCIGLLVSIISLILSIFNIGYMNEHIGLAASFGSLSVSFNSRFFSVNAFKAIAIYQSTLLLVFHFVALMTTYYIRRAFVSFEKHYDFFNMKNAKAFKNASTTLAFGTVLYTLISYLGGFYIYTNSWFDASAAIPKLKDFSDSISTGININFGITILVLIISGVLLGFSKLIKRGTEYKEDSESFV